MGNINQTWLTADTHFGHKNIIRYCNRPFSSIQEHDEALIHNWNTRVGKTDTVFHLGDFSFGDDDFFHWIISRLNGKIIFIQGNHDDVARRNKHRFHEYYYGYHELSLFGKFCVFSHYAFEVWNKSHHGSYNFYGHSHGGLPDNPNALKFDVGIDCFNYAPISFKQAYEIMDKKAFKAPDLTRKTV